MASYRIAFTYDSVNGGYTYEVIDATVAITSSALPSGAATSAKQLADGHNVAVSNMIPAVETGLATSAKQLADGHSVSVSNMIPAVETGLATSAKQLADGHSVAVSNMIPAVETGLSTSAKQLADGHNVQIKGYTGASYQYPRLDASTFAIETITVEHHEVHGGRSFTCHYTQLVSDIADRSIIAFLTPSGLKEIHIIMAIAAQDAALAYILEAPTVTADTGAPLTVFNRNRVIDSASIIIDTSQNPDVVGQATYFTEATMGNVTGGTKLEEVQMIAGQGPRILGGQTRGSEEFILAPSTQYAFVIESLNNNDNLHNIRLDWYEHTPKS